MRRGSRLLLGVLLALVLACSGSAALSHDDVLEVQEAAVVFLAIESVTGPDSAICIRFAERPGEMVEGMVAKGLQDPPAAFLDRLRAGGIAAQPFSSCNPQLGTFVLAIGWPSPVPGGVEVPADRLCDPMCGNGFKVHVRRTAEGWRAVAARATWVS